jgi:hypothetical protein
VRSSACKARLGASCRPSTALSIATSRCRRLSCAPERNSFPYPDICRTFQSWHRFVPIALFGPRRRRRRRSGQGKTTTPLRSRLACSPSILQDLFTPSLRRLPNSIIGASHAAAVNSTDRPPLFAARATNSLRVDKCTRLSPRTACPGCVMQSELGLASVLENTVSVTSPITCPSGPLPCSPHSVIDVSSRHRPDLARSGTLVAILQRAGKSLRRARGARVQLRPHPQNLLRAVFPSCAPCQYNRRRTGSIKRLVGVSQDTG